MKEKSESYNIIGVVPAKASCNKNILLSTGVATPGYFCSSQVQLEKGSSRYKSTKSFNVAKVCDLISIF